ncbi:HTH domain-containing protein [uncultured Secundilactobacillus sp.]|nr:HTH domain-containing protein [uncultured Secundilactobacillus sp.]
MKTEIRVLRCLRTGADNKTTMRELKKKTGYGERIIYDAIELLRMKGLPIMASRSNKDGGYFIASTEQEKLDGLAQYRKQIATETHHLRLLEKADVDGYLPSISDEPELWKELSERLIEVTPTSDGATISVKTRL